MLKPTIDQPLYLRPAKAAKLLDIGRTKIYELIHRGEIKAILIGGQLRIPRAEIEGLAQRATTDPLTANTELEQG
jgi:excisionase family DNA binding protein